MPTNVTDPHANLAPYRLRTPADSWSPSGQRLDVGRERRGAHARRWFGRSSRATWQPARGCGTAKDGPERLRVFRSCPLVTPKDARSSLQILVIARAMTAVCAQIGRLLAHRSDTLEKLSASDGQPAARALEAAIGEGNVQSVRRHLVDGAEPQALPWHGLLEASPEVEQLLSAAQMLRRLAPRRPDTSILNSPVFQALWSLGQ